MGVQNLIFKEALQKYTKVPAEHLTEYVGFYYVEKIRYTSAIFNYF